MIVTGKLTADELQAPFVKAVADVQRGVLSVGCDLPIDCAEELLQDGSGAEDLWGINIYPDRRIDFISLMNIRPAAGNRTIEIRDPELRAKIESIVRAFL